MRDFHRVFAQPLGTVWRLEVHLVSTITVPSLRCLGLVAVPSKTNEITALRQLVDPIDLEGH